MYKYVIRPLLFKFDPETAHRLAVKLLQTPLIPAFFRMLYGFRSDSLKRNVFGLTFRNPVGLAAGFDKNAELLDGITALGFGFIEIGTITPKPQSGNPRPRLFRLPADQALINRMGFNNEGVEAVRNRLKAKKRDILIGGNIGKNKNTPNSRAADDYLACFDVLYDCVDYFVVNVSSPNTPGLRALQERDALLEILGRLSSRNQEKPVLKPILLKIAPDLTREQLDDIVLIVSETGTSGIVASNTTISREGLNTEPSRVRLCGDGGLSGRPLRDRSTEIIRYLVKKSEGKIPIIGVGGIQNPEDALEKLAAGASLVQIYTGFIYEGPGLIRRIKKSISQTLNHP